MAICWYCGCNFEKDDKSDTKCPECGRNAVSKPMSFLFALIVFGCMIGFQPKDDPNGGIILLGILGIISTLIYAFCSAIKTIKLNKQWVKKQKNKNKSKPTHKEHLGVEISPFVAMGKSNGEAIRFDIKPDREIEIEYQDASGDITRRKITAQVIRTAWGGLVIEAYCHLRQSQRSFKLENIRRLYENGHEINVVDWLEQIGFSQNRRVKKRIVKKKISDMVDKMPTSALDEFIKNSN